MNNIFLGTQKADYYAGGTQVDSIYLGTALVYNREIPPPPLEVPFAAIKHASGYTGMPVARLWETSTREWFMMKGDGTYTQYGIYADDISHTGYEGELAIYDGHEYEYSGGTWVDLGGKVERELPSPEYIMTTEYESQQIQLQYHVTENTKVRVKFGNYGGDGGIYFGNNDDDNNDWRAFRLMSSNYYFDVVNSRFYGSYDDFNNKNLEYGNFYIKNLDSGTFIHQGEAKEEIELPNDDFYILRDRGQMYYIDIYEGNTLKLSLRPVIHDGKCGFVDVLTGDFHIGNNMSSGGTMGSVTILTWPKSYDAIPSPDLSTVTADTLSDLEAIPDDERFLGMGGVTDSGTGHYRLSYQNEWESVTLGRAVMFQVVRTDGVTNYLRCDNPGNFDIEYTSDGGSTWWPYFEDVAFTHDNPVYVRGTSDAGFDGQLSFATASVDQTDVSGYLDALLDYTQEWEGQLPDNAFRYLFNNSYWRDCSGLILPSESGKYAYQGMFSGCTDLTVAPELPAMELKDYCYASMFSHCSSLAETPELPATKLAQHCYDIMFEHCTSLTDIAYMPTPERMYPFCYAAMYRYCTGLVHVTQTTPNVQPDDESFTSLFEGCTNLEDVPFDFLPATTLGDKPYYHLFKNCTKLTDAPELPAIRVSFMGYWAMFEGCSSLTSITANFTSIRTGGLLNWVAGVASAGTFYRNEDLEEETIGYGNSGIPSGWTVVPPYVHEVKALKFSTVNSGETNTMTIIKATNISLQYSVNGGSTWSEWDFDSGVTFGNGQDLYIRGDNPSGFNLPFSRNQFRFASSGTPVSVSGNIMWLLDYTQDLDTIPSSWCFAGLFKGCNGITDMSGFYMTAPNLNDNCYQEIFVDLKTLEKAPIVSGATVCKGGCYCSMFSGCENLYDISGVEIQFATLTGNTCEDMFKGCKSLTVAPDLPATNLSAGCYRHMFSGCTSLTVAPDLPATSSDYGCYTEMFNGCTSLTDSPHIYAISVGSQTFNGMFSGCTSLTSITADFSAVTSGGLTNWVAGVASAGTFYRNENLAESAITYGNSGIPSGWTVVPPFEQPVIRALKFSTVNPSETNTLRLHNIGGNAPSMEYSTDNGQTWTAWNYSAVTFGNGTDLYIRGMNPSGFSSGIVKYSTFVFGNSANTVDCFGNVMHLLDYTQDLTTIPNNDCFSHLFQDCKALASSPELPATTLAGSCYLSMFNGCTSLTTAPTLPATTLAYFCYQGMFLGCASLTSITADFSAVTINALINWVAGVASAGTFYRNEDLEEEAIGYGNSGIPSGWTVVPPYIHPDYRALKFSTVNTGETNELWLVNNGGNEPDLEYSYDGLDWEAWDYSGLTFGNGQDLYIRGNNLSGLNQSRSIYSQFSSLTSSVTFEVSGNIMHLLDWEQELTEIPNDYCFYSLFRERRNIVSVPELPATVLKPYCYQSLFRGCTSLATAPVLPATTLTEGCYVGLFYSCTSIDRIDSRATDISATGALGNWMVGVASEGTFYCPKGMGDVYPRDLNGIPTGWTIVEDL